MFILGIDLGKTSKEICCCFWRHGETDGPLAQHGLLSSSPIIVCDLYMCINVGIHICKCVYIRLSLLRHMHVCVFVCVLFTQYFRHPLMYSDLLIYSYATNSINLICYSALESPPLVPFFPLLMKDLAFMHEGNETMIDGLVNFDKLRLLSRELRLVCVFCM